MRKKHVIQRLTVEIHYPSQELAQERQDEIIVYVRKLLLSELQRLFDSLSYSDEVISIDKLEIDLGSFHHEGLYDDLAQKLKHELENVMMKLVYDIRLSTDGRATLHFSVPGGGIMSVEARMTKPSRSALEKLFYFLFYGVLPWSADTTGSQAIHDLAEDALDGQSVTFVNALRETAARSSVFQRLSFQLSERQLMRLMALLSEAGEDRLDEWTGDVYYFLQEWVRLTPVVPQAWQSVGSEAQRRQLYGRWLQVFAKKHSFGWSEEQVMTAWLEMLLAEASASGEREILQSLWAWMKLGGAFTADDRWFFGTVTPGKSSKGKRTDKNKGKHSDKKSKDKDSPSMSDDAVKRRPADPESGDVQGPTGTSPENYSGTLSDEQLTSLQASAYAAGLSNEELFSLAGQGTFASATHEHERMQLFGAMFPLRDRTYNEFRSTYAALAAPLRKALEQLFRSHPAAIVVASACAEDYAQAGKAAASKARLEAFRLEKIRLREEAAEQEKETRKRAITSEDKTAEEKLRDAFSEETELIADEDIYIRNAGLVLLWPYLNTYFTRIGLVENKAFVSDEARHKAVHVLQWLATGEENETEEHELLLNKILCGIPITESVPTFVALTDEDKEEGENLLKLVISRWEIIKRSSIRTLRDTFLKKEGKIRQEGNSWHLVIPRQSAVDIVIDRLPWGIGMIKMHWNTGLLLVEW